LGSFSFDQSRGSYALSENYPGREKVLDLLKAHIRGLSALHGSEGFWHQLLDRNDS
jgi:unsaturated rhamnogalacturonyl hydrolase